MQLKSLDPRITRLKITEQAETFSISPLDQFGTYEVFLQPKEGKPQEHAGIVHAPELEMAFLFAKEQFSRRSDVQVSPYSENSQDLYELLPDELEEIPQGEMEDFEIFHLYKRGKQHLHAGTVKGRSVEEALINAGKQVHDGKKPVLNIWLIPSQSILKSNEENREIWNTLPDKKYRDVTDYKAADKIKHFKEENQIS
jgi:ring-1,2-phenylacetyl-CoA epoxidase subunit PaaB